ncbi:MAG: amidohydrolase family protein [Planctomycetota bacterium]
MSLMSFAMLLTLVAGPSAALPEEGFAIVGSKIFTAADAVPVVDNGVVLVKEKKILAVGRRSEVAIPTAWPVIDATGKWVVPGIVDAHDHSAGNLRDLNDLIYLTNPDLRTLDTIYPDSEPMRQAREGGVTTVLQIPGSGVNMTGFGVIAKTWGHTQKEVVLRFPGVIKIAQSGNPERYWYGVNRSFMNWNTRDTLKRMRAYVQAWEDFEAGKGAGRAPGRPVEQPKVNPFWHDFLGVFDRTVPAAMHTQIYQVVLETIKMMHDEFHIVPILDHSTFDAFKLGPLAAERGIYVVAGPRQLHFDRNERTIWGVASEWWRRGVERISINTDAPVVPQEELPYQAAMAAHFGLPDGETLRGITIMPARALMVDDRVGSIEPGKDADIGIWTGNPVDPRSRCEKLFVNGGLAYCCKRDDGRF